MPDLARSRRALRQRRPAEVLSAINAELEATLCAQGEVLLSTRRQLEALSAEHERLRDQVAHAAERLSMMETLQCQAPVGFGLLDRDLRLVSLNETMFRLTQFSPDDVGRLLRDVAPDRWPSIEPVYRRVLDTGEPDLDRTAVTELPNGGSIFWLVNLYPVRVEGELKGIGVIGVDITERTSEAVFRSALLDTMAEGLYALDADGRLTLMNSAASKLLGWTEEELLGQVMHDVVHYQRADGSPFPIEECELVKARLRGQAVRMTEDAFIRKDGSILPVAYSAVPLRHDDGVRGVVVVFRDATDELAERARVRRELDALSWVGRTRDALDEGRMVLYSQPIVPLAGGPPSEELLIRMVGRAGEIIPPGSFLPVAERYGLIGEIDRWVISQAAEVAAQGRQVEINISAESISSVDLLPLIERELAAAGAPPENLVFELTETAIMNDMEAGEAFARGVTALGCGVALDDFGMGYGSFTYLTCLPVTFLKIDVAFVRDLPDNPAHQHLVKAIVNLAEGFGHQTIAEGVEDQQTLELLRSYGVHFAQGFHVGRPEPLVTA